MSADSPVAILYDSAGNPIAKSDNAVVPGATNFGVLPAIANAAAPVKTEGNQVSLSTDLAGNLRVLATLATGTDRTSTGTITAAQNVAVNTQASGACSIQITGIWTGTIVFEATANGTDWQSVNGIVPDTGVEVTQTTVNGLWVVACAGFSQVRARGNTVTVGTATVFLESSTATQVVTLGDPLPTGGNVIGAVTQSAGPWTQNLTQIGGAAITEGQKPMATSVPVVIASDQSAIPISAASLPLPAGASTEATLALIKAKTDNLDVLLSSRAVTGLTDAQLRASAVPVSAASLPLPTGAATEATLATRVADATITARLGVLGQAAMAASAPVAIASDQSDIGVKQATASNLNAQVVGDVANASADSGKPVKVGGVGRTTNPTAVADGQRVNAYFDKDGRIASTISPRELRKANTISLTTTTETTLLAAGAASVFRDVIFISISNSGNNLNRIDIRDATGGTVRFSIHCDSGVTVLIPIPTPWPQTTAANNWTAQLSATPGGGGSPSVRINILAVEDN